MTAAKLDVSTLLGDDVMWTLLGTLYLRAYESRSPQSILHDHHAAEALDRIDYDEPKLARRLNPKANQYLVALRAKQFDNWTTAFLQRHPDATVLHLGCGLDSRALRLTVPDDVRWYDVDQPDVIAVRRQLYPEHGGFRMIAASVTDADWLLDLPADKPALVVAEGLLPYLAPEAVRVLLSRLTDRFAQGELLFDASAPWLTKLAKVFRFSLRDGLELERWNPRLRLVENAPFTTMHALIPSPGYRWLYRIGHGIPVWRNMIAEYRFAF